MVECLYNDWDLGDMRICFGHESGYFVFYTLDFSTYIVPSRSINYYGNVGYDSSLQVIMFYPGRQLEEPIR